MYTVTLDDFYYVAHQSKLWIPRETAVKIVDRVNHYMHKAWAQGEDITAGFALGTIHFVLQEAF
jgi:hypothetical protein